MPIWGHKRGFERGGGAVQGFPPLGSVSRHAPKQVTALVQCSVSCSKKGPLRACNPSPENDEASFRDDGAVERRDGTSRVLGATPSSTWARPVTNPRDVSAGRHGCSCQRGQERTRITLFGTVVLPNEFRVF